jgi:hypothetical protein
MKRIDCEADHLFDDLLEPFLELAAVHGAGHQAAHVQHEQALVEQRLGHVAVDDALRQPFDDGRLAHARLADQRGVVLGAAAQESGSRARSLAGDR